MRKSIIHRNLLSSDDIEALAQAREKFGERNQIAVAAEECCELAKELLKYMRYGSHEKAVADTRKAVAGEVADVIIVLDHVLEIFQISDEDLSAEIGLKMGRVKKWLASDEGMEITTKLRELE